MRFVNLTPHVLHIRRTDGTVLTLPPSGPVARVATKTVPLTLVDGILVSRAAFGPVTDLPDPAPHTLYIVSTLVAQAAHRDDVVAPGELIRDADGQPVACDGLRAPW
jgi:hypothetical protein